MPDAAGPTIVIAGTREDWPGGPRTLTPRYPTREPNGTLWFGAELPAGDQVWFRIAEEAIGRMPEKTPRDRGARLVDALIVWITPDRQDVNGYLEELNERCNRLYEIQCRHDDDPRLPNIESRRVEVSDWFSEQDDCIRQKFEPYLRLQ